MGQIPLLAVYLAPAVLVLLNMVRTRTLSLFRISGLLNTSKTITLEEWLAVCGYLALRLESRKQLPATKPRRPWRIMCSGAPFAASLALSQFILPLNLPLSFAQHDWNVYPVVQVAIAGGALAFSLMLAFHRSRRWRLIEEPGVEYQFLKWGALKKKTAMENTK